MSVFFVRLVFLFDLLIIYIANRIYCCDASNLKPFNLLSFYTFNEHFLSKNNKLHTIYKLYYCDLHKWILIGRIVKSMVLSYIIKKILGLKSLFD